MMGQMFQFPKREPKWIEDICRKEFGYVICPHKVYIPNQYCAACDALESKSLQQFLNICNCGNSSVYIDGWCGICGPFPESRKARSKKKDVR